ncbi:MAG: hypothetical protein FRX49_12887 [Trebouxia sp. A1-2]|nr:MAG: hypothetical protein FRX49_12887 [Trebouxia sp. A1-2]
MDGPQQLDIKIYMLCCLFGIVPVQSNTDQLGAIIKVDVRVQSLPELHGEEDVCRPWPLRRIMVLSLLAIEGGDPLCHGGVLRGCHWGRRESIRMVLHNYIQVVCQTRGPASHLLKGLLPQTWGQQLQQWQQPPPGAHVAPPEAHEAPMLPKMLQMGQHWQQALPQLWRAMESCGLLQQLTDCGILEELTGSWSLRDRRQGRVCMLRRGTSPRGQGLKGSCDVRGQG